MKKNLNAIEGLVIFLLMFLSAATPYTIMFIFILSGFIMMVCILEIKTTTLFFPKIIILLLLFQNVIIGVGAKIGGQTSPDLKYITQVVTIFMLILSISCIISGKYKLKRFDILGLILACLLLYYFMVSPISFEYKAIYLRNFFIFYLGIIVGKSYIKNDEQFIKITKFIIKWSVITTIFGMFLMIISDRVWFNVLGITEVYIAKGSAIYDELPGRFSTTIFNFKVNRMASFYYEPVNLSYFIMIGALLSWFANWTKNKQLKNIVILILIIGQFLTFGKGGLLITVVTILLVYLFKFLETMLHTINPKKIYTAIQILGIGMVVVFSIFYYHNFAGYAKPHFEAIIKTEEKIASKPFGYGLGSGGNVGEIEKGEKLDTGGESGMMTMAYQVGVIFTVVFILTFECIGYKNIKDIEKRTTDKVYLMLAFLSVALLIGIVFQENALSPQCIIPITIILGSSLNNENSEEIEKIVERGELC